MILDFLKENIPSVITLIAGAGAWGYERNKRNSDLLKAKAEVARYETENNASIINLYKDALDDFKKRSDERFSELQFEIDSLKSRLKGREQEYNDLKQEFLAYKRKHL